MSFYGYYPPPYYCITPTVCYYYSPPDYYTPSTSGYFPPPDYSDTPSTYTYNSPSKSSSSGVVVGIGVGAAIVVILIVAITCLCICLRRRRRRRAKQQLAFASNGATKVQMAASAAPTGPAGTPFFSDSSKPRTGIISSAHLGPRSFTYEQLSIATKNFSDTELLGKGGSGSVYRGRLPDDGTVVAVKCIPADSDQGAKEFNAEVSIISELRHRNLVRLKGWCHGEGKYLLVYDYMHNGSLDYLLHNDANCIKLNWERRYAIASGLGSALLYLHEECERVFIHRDVKSSNLLLDEGFIAKLGDFGLSRGVDPGVTSHVTSVVAGTLGYMAPECLAGSGKATRESDMYAFGVVLLEIVTGRRPLDPRLQKHKTVMVDWVWDLYGQGKVLLAVDKRLGRDWDTEAAKRMLIVGLACLHPEAEGRPKIRQAMEAINGTVPVPYVLHSKPNPGYAVSVAMKMAGMGTSSSASSNSISTQNSGSSHEFYPVTRPPFAR